MITDATLLFDSSKALTSAGVVFSTDKVDLSMVRDLGEGYPVSLLITVTETFQSSTTGVAQFGLALSAAADMSNASYIANSGLYGQFGLLAPTGNDPGTQILVPLPGLISIVSATVNADGARYLAAVYTVTNTFTAGKIRAELILDPQTLNGRKYYSKSFVID